MTTPGLRNGSDPRPPLPGRTQPSHPRLNPMKPTDITAKLDQSTGNLDVVLKNASGEEVSLQLTPELQSRLLAALLAKTPGPQHTSQGQFHSRTLKTIGVQAFRLASGHPGLQFLVGPAQAVDVAFPQESIPVIQKCLAQLASGKPLEAGPMH